MPVFLTGTFPPEIIFPVYFKIEVGAVKVRPGCIQAIFFLNTMSEDVDYLLILYPVISTGLQYLVI